MNSTKKLEITSRQLLFITISVMIGSGLLTLPRIAVEQAKQDGWIIVALGAFFPLISILTISFIYKRFEDHDFYEMCNSLLGNFLGKAIVFIYIVYGILLCPIVIALFSDTVDSYLLPQTPSFIKIFIILFTILYVISGGIKVVGRFNEFLFYIYIPILLFIIPGLTKAEWSFLAPIASTPIPKLIKGSLVTSFAYAGIESLFIFYPFVKSKNEALKASIIGLFITVAIYVYVTVMCTAMFGMDYMETLIWPTLAIFKTVRIPVVERLEFFVLLLWIGIAFRPIMIQYFCTRYLISKLFNVKESSKIMNLILFIIMFLLSFIPKSVFEGFEYAGYIGYVSMFIGLVIPVFFSIILILFKNKGESNE